MTDRLEDLIRDTMRATASQVRTPPDLADRALARRSARRVRHTLAVGGTAIATAAAALVVPLALGSRDAATTATVQRTGVPRTDTLGATNLDGLGNEAVEQVGLSSYVVRESDGLLHAYIRNPTDGTFRRTDDSWALVSPDGNSAAALTNSFSDDLQIVDTRTGRSVSSYSTGGVAISTPYWSSDGSTLLATEWGAVDASGRRTRIGYAVIPVHEGVIAGWSSYPLGGGAVDGRLDPRDLAAHWRPGGRGVVASVPCPSDAGAPSPVCATVDAFGPVDVPASTAASWNAASQLPLAGATAPMASSPSAGATSEPPTSVQEAPSGTGLPDVEFPPTSYSVYSPDGTHLLTEDNRQEGAVYDAASGARTASGLPTPLGWADNGHVIATRVTPGTARPQVVLVDLSGTVTQVLYTGQPGEDLPQLFFTPTGE